MKDKIVITLWSDHINSEHELSWLWVANADGFRIEPDVACNSKSSALRAAKRALARLQACKKVEVICDAE